MNRRFWLYVAATAFVSAQGVWVSVNNHHWRSVIAAIDSNSSRERTVSVEKFLSNQTDGHKLIGLAKRYLKTEPDLVRPVIEKAYQLDPNSRDIAIFASFYNKDAKERVKVIDPLWSESN